MGFIGTAIVMNMVTWYYTSSADVGTRKQKREKRAARAADRKGESVVQGGGENLGEKVA